MKSPKLIGGLGPNTGVGMSKARALDNVEAPFLTSAGPGFIARKKNGFSEVEMLPTAAAPPAGFLWMMRLDGADGAAMQVKLEKPGATRQKASTVSAPPTEYWAAAGGLYVGGGRIAALTEDGTDWADTQAQASLFKRAGGGRTGFGWRPGLAHTMFATGWDAARGAYRWGFVAKQPPFAADGVSLAPLAAATVHAANETNVYLSAGAGAMTHVVPPNAGASRAHFGGHLYVTGPGQLTGLVIVKAQATFSPPSTFVLDQEDPHFLHSTDHGESWTVLSGAFLLPLLKRLTQASTSPPGQEYPDPASAAYMAAYSWFVYLGNGKSLFIVRRTTTTSRTDFRASCYLFEAGVFTPLAWGYDASTDTIAAPRFTRIARGTLSDSSGAGVSLMSSDSISPTDYCFGPGCCAIPTQRGVVFSTMVCVLRVTRDYGATWSEVVLPAEFDGASGAVPAFVVQAPYLDTDRPGKIYMLSTTAAGGSRDWRCYSTDGHFAEFVDMGPVVVPASPDNWSQLATLATKTRPLYPQLPDEFRPPA